jgi:ribosomal protein L3 glutamine methyltransferase
VSKPRILPLREPLVLADAIRQSAAVFEAHGLSYGHGTDNAIDEASWLLLDVLGLSPLQAPDYQRPLNAEDCMHCNAAVEQRVTHRRPTAYLTGTAWFAGHEFRCDDRALVPRSPLAEWIVGDFFGMLPEKHGLRLLDLCTGGGCIAIACAHALPGAQVDASDISADALRLAAENVELHGLQDRLRLLHGSLFEPASGRYDLIVSNPPYVDAGDIAAMPAEFHHEPALGLASGPDGLDFVRRLLLEAEHYLGAEGLLVVEVGNSAPALEAAYPMLPFTWLEFEQGGDGIFVLTKSELDTHSGELKAAYPASNPLH